MLSVRRRMVPFALFPCIFLTDLCRKETALRESQGRFSTDVAATQIRRESDETSFYSYLEKESPSKAIDKKKEVY